MIASETTSENRRTAEVTRLLQNCALFCDLNDSDRRALASHATRRSYSSGDVIFHAGDPGESLIGIVNGEVRISRTSAAGGMIIINDLGSGEVFGEIALIDGAGRSADAGALTRCELIVLERREFMPVVRERPELCIDLLRALCAKIRLADERSTDFLFLDLGSRLAKALLRLCPSPEAAGRSSKTSLSQGELAKIVGATRSNINRQIKEWERRGIIKLSKGWIVIHNRADLKAAAGP